ncbi:MAG: single-stranded-DNA-specific exonuclease RecJ [Victivallaceae bacterium]|nr:single-stranded-DNA-specific exonuclease RecJ [Victivallaceae bacterium]
MRNWKSSVKDRQSEISAIQNSAGVPRSVAMYFAARDVAPEMVSGFLQPKLGALSDPYRFPGIQFAAERLWRAIANGEHILIHGDYDTDGITASALLALVLRSNGATVNSFIPHRFDDGYGFTPESLDKALTAFGPCKVLVTVDCGITSCDAVKKATEMGIDVIVTDHHEAADVLPAAIAVINPKIYPELEDLQLLSGAGTAFKLSHGVIKYGREHHLGGEMTNLEDILDFVALGTVADIVPLLGENRIMVSKGIDILRRQLRPGIRTLIESSKLRNDVTPSDITFRLAPRINAAGRVGDANVALRLLESESIVDAYRYAAELENCNAIRQEKEQEIYQEAKLQIERNLAWQSDYALLVAGRDWHQGVIGIVASRLARDYNRPAIVLTIQGDQAYGSGRSISNINLIGVLAKLSHLLERYGGHPMAVGVGLKTENIAPFFESLDREIRNSITAEDLESYVSYDGELDITELDSNFFHYMEMLSPFGHGNPKPVYRFNDLKLARVNLVGNRHCRGILRSNTGSINFIAFNRRGDDFAYNNLDVLATPQMNTHAGRTELQLCIVDVRNAGI